MIRRLLFFNLFFFLIQKLRGFCGGKWWGSFPRVRLARRSGAGASSTLSAAPPAPSLSPSPSHGSLPAGPRACPHPPVAHRSRAHVLGGPWGGFKGMESCCGARGVLPWGALRPASPSLRCSAAPGDLSNPQR